MRRIVITVEIAQSRRTVLAIGLLHVFYARCIGEQCLATLFHTISLTVLHGFNKKCYDDVVGVWNTVHLEILCQVAHTVDKSLRKKALATVSFSVLCEERVF
jgi:hypothetical protein